MKKMTACINLDYMFDSTHKGANYTFDGGQHWVNNGEFCEIVAKSVLGYEAKKDANTAYDKASDIEEINASVKSSRFTLTNMKLGTTKEDSIRKYFKTVHSTLWVYVVVFENEATLYFMDAKEFESFLYGWSSLNERGVIRSKATSGKMIAWFESQVA